jgi:hypothetical protein
VCALNASCCSGQWGLDCQKKALANCAGACGCQDKSDGCQDRAEVPGTSDPVCGACVCFADPECCSVGWTSQCAARAMDQCAGSCACAQIAWPIKLTDVTAASGLLHTYSPDAAAIPKLEEWMAGGAAVGDFNGDGYPDLFAPGGGLVADALFINQGDGSFADEAVARGLGELHCSNGAAVADYDADGDQDLFVASFGPAGQAGSPGHHRLYRNDGDGTFVDVAVEAGVNQTSSLGSTAYTPNFGDFDLDGDLDLFVAGWWGGTTSLQGNRLFRNDGDGTFTDVSAQALPASSLTAWGFTATFADMDGDRYPELLLAADFLTSRYYVNQGDGTFLDLTVPSGTGIDSNGMGHTIADFDNDGRLDWYVTSIHADGAPTGKNSGNMLFVNQGGHVYFERSKVSGTNDGGWGWGAVHADFDQDGWLDLVEVNGRPSQGIAGEWDGERSRLYHNLGGGQFAEVGWLVGLIDKGQGRGVGTLDLDRDGDLDLFVVNNLEPIALFRNDTPDAGSWLVIELERGTNATVAPHGFGARVVARTGATEQVRTMDGAPSYLGTSELILHFGLGGATHIDELRVEWPGGQDTVLIDVAANQRLTITAPAQHDLNADGAVDALDLALLLLHMGPVHGPADRRCDLDRSGVVDVRDLWLLLP